MTDDIHQSGKKTGLDHFIHAFGWSVAGLKATWQHEAAFRQDLLLALILMPLGAYLGTNGVEKALLMGSVWLVLIVEILNTSIESVVNRIGLEHHELSGRAKDQGSAAVMLSLILVAIIWISVLFG